MSNIDKPLADLNILLIEADSFLAHYIGGSVKRAGGKILGPALTVEEANTLLAGLYQPPYAAVVSAALLEAAGSPVAETLTRLAVPMLVIGSGRSQEPRSPQHAVLATPFAAYQVVDHLRRIPYCEDPGGSTQRVFGPALRGH